MNEAPLVERVRSLVQRTQTLATTHAAKQHLEVLSERLDEPLRVAIAGKVKAGKSTLLNALVGQELAPTDAGECTRIVTWYRDGVTYRVTLFPNEGQPFEVPFDHEGGSLRIDLGDSSSEDVRRLIVDWPSSSLRSMTLIDTPGIASVSLDVAQKARAFLIGADDDPAASDAVLYLMRHLHATDVSFLEAFREQQQAQSTPINAIGILSRADEIGVGKLQAMQTAERIAARYRGHPEVRRLCQTVVPVSALVAQAGVTLREEHFAALSQIARAPVDHAEALVLSTDRFLAGSGQIEVPAETRRALLDRFGLFGIRYSVAVIRRGSVTSAPKLAELLVQLSGLPRLRAVLASQFAARRDVLKARAALLTLGSIVRAGGVDNAEAVASELERIEAGAHEFAEIGLLNALRARSVVFSEDAHDEAERLLGARGGDAYARLALPQEASTAELRAQALDALQRWQVRAENPLATREVEAAARVVVRTLEGLLAAATLLDNERAAR